MENQEREHHTRHRWKDQVLVRGITCSVLLMCEVCEPSMGVEGVLAGPRRTA